MYNTYVLYFINNYVIYIKYGYNNICNYEFTHNHI